MPKEVNKKPVQSMKPQMSEEQKLQMRAEELFREKAKKFGQELDALQRKYGMRVVARQVIDVERIK